MRIIWAAVNAGEGWGVVLFVAHHGRYAYGIHENCLDGYERRGGLGVCPFLAHHGRYAY
ncbi:MAG: hypothetical protein BWX80_02037 [Candidatus Hydrogenedentes bacterium ADurb.Bin101]|nr:MAG: hypothetical protein BWX80_02037 [Candidatus Hydrogenedentes bacterium ADurb.Bin101]